MQLPLPADSSFLWLIAVALSTWRITAFVCYEAGPLDVGSHLRRAIVSMGLGRLVTCFHCTSVWVSFTLTFAVFELHWRTLLIAMSVAGAVSVLERWLGGEAFGSTTGES
jgi:hypothetical protein